MKKEIDERVVIILNQVENASPYLENRKLNRHKSKVRLPGLRPVIECEDESSSLRGKFVSANAWRLKELREK